MRFVGDRSHLTGKLNTTSDRLSPQVPTGGGRSARCTGTVVSFWGGPPWQRYNILAGPLLASSFSWGLAVWRLVCSRHTYATSSYCYRTTYTEHHAARDRCTGKLSSIAAFQVFPYSALASVCINLGRRQESCSGVCVSRTPCTIF